MACFPICIDINDKKCLVVGGGNVAKGKIEQLKEFGADITVIAPFICDEIKSFCKYDKVHIVRRTFSDDDVEGMTIVVAATDHLSVNKRVSDVCRERNIPVNVVDEKELCSFFFPAIIKEEELVISVSTNGTSPLLASHIKEKIYKEVIEEGDKNYGRIAGIMGKYREYIKKRIDDTKLRKKAYEEILDLLLDHNEISDEDVDSILKKFHK